MKQNKKYGRLVDGNVVYAPEILTTNIEIITLPKKEDYLNEGWFEIVIDNQPNINTNDTYYVANGWEQTETQIVRTWAEHKVVTSKSKNWKVETLIYGLIKHNALQSVKQIVGDFWELFTMKDILNESNEIFTEKWPEFKQAIIESGSLTEEEINQIFHDSEV